MAAGDQKSGLIFRNAWNVADSSGNTSAIGVFQRGTRLQFKQRFSLAQIDGTTAPAARFWEGPFLRITPNLWDGTGKAFSRRVWDDNAVAPDPTNVSQTIGGSSDFFYEVDLPAQTLWLPFTASLSLNSARARMIALDVLWLDQPNTDDDDDDRAKARERDSVQELSQTRIAAVGEGPKTVDIPMGCTEYLLMADAATVNVDHEYENIGKAGGVGGSSRMTLPVPRAMRVPVGAARRLIFSATATAPVAVTFYVRLR